jgi:hypothetical protein
MVKMHLRDEKTLCSECDHLASVLLFEVVEQAESGIAEHYRFLYGKCYMHLLVAENDLPNPWGSRWA